MSWAIAYDHQYHRYVGYGVPGICEHPRCDKEIDRGLSYVCGSEPYGGDFGCGLFFCSAHLSYRKPRGAYRSVELCGACIQYRGHYPVKPDTREWVEHMLTDESWARWRRENTHEAALMQASLTKTA